VLLAIEDHAGEAIDHIGVGVKSNGDPQARTGDLVAELDASELADKRVSQEIAVQNARAASTKANENLKIQEIENESLIAKAEQQVDFTATELGKFLEGDKPQQLRKAEEDILLAEEELKRAADPEPLPEPELPAVTPLPAPEPQPVPPLPPAPQL